MAVLRKVPTGELRRTPLNDHRLIALAQIGMIALGGVSLGPRLRAAGVSLAGRLGGRFALAGRLRGNTTVGEEGP